MKKKKKISPTKMGILALSNIEERSLNLDSKTIKKLENFLAKSGAKNEGLSLSDLVANLLLQKGKNGFKFKKEKNELKDIKLKMPVAAWNIAEISAQKSESELSEVVKNLAAEI